MTPDELLVRLAAKPYPRCMMCRGMTRASGLFQVDYSDGTKFMLLCAEHGFDPLGTTKSKPTVKLIKSFTTTFHTPEVKPEDQTYNTLARKVLDAVNLKNKDKL